MGRTDPLVQPMTALLPPKTLSSRDELRSRDSERLEVQESTQTGPLVAPSGSAGPKTVGHGRIRAKKNPA
jgi:hypothetical protein